MAVGTYFEKPGRRRRPAPNPELDGLMQGLAQTKVQINQAYLGFNSVADPDLVESYVFEIRALQARYSYLLRRLKEIDAVI